MISVDIFFERPLEKSEICSCMYMRNVSLVQLPCSLMVLSLTLFKCMVIAPPASKLWLPMDFLGRPYSSKFRFFIADLTTALISPPVTWCSTFCLLWYVSIIVLVGCVFGDMLYSANGCFD